MSDILLPDLGEGVKGGIVAAIPVKIGDKVSFNDALIEIETDKAVLPVPAPRDGVVTKVLVSVGDKISVGQAIVAFEGGVEAPKLKTPTPAVTLASAPPVASSMGTKKSTLQLPDLGEGVKGGIVTALVAKVGSMLKEGEALIEIETDKAVLPVPSPVSGKLLALTVAVGEKISVGQVMAEVEAEVSGSMVQNTSPASAASASARSTSTASPAVSSSTTPKKTTSMPGASVAAGPATRKLARELGIDLLVIQGSRRGGRVSVEDVKLHVKSMNLGAKKPGEEARNIPEASGIAAPNWSPVPDFSKFGSVRREKMTNLRKVISDRMSMCWNRIPHVFQFNEVDLTSLAQVQARYKDDFKDKGSSVSPTNFIIKAMAICLREFPQFNTSLDEQTGEIIYKSYVNIGVAVDTPTGLIVPVLKNVDQLSIFQIGKDLKTLAQKTRDRKVSQEDLSGGSMTLSNLGGIGGTHFTPIVNWPEVAILGVGKAEMKAKYINGELVPRHCSQMTLSYDHRVIDGADGARFMVRLTEILENIERTLLGG